MKTLNRFRIVRLSKELQHEFRLGSIVCADSDGLPFVEGQAFYEWLIDDNACRPATALNYLHMVLRFLTYLWDGSPPLLYTAPPDELRSRVRDYLKQQLGCVVKRHRAGNYVVLNPRSGASARLFLVALKRYYAWATLTGRYPKVNPLEWSAPLLPANTREMRMPVMSGLTEPPDPNQHYPSTYFCMLDEAWQPQIIHDPDLFKRLPPAFSHFRDQIIARILFESGARVSEVLTLTLGDWRASNHYIGADAASKGSAGRRVKTIFWSFETDILLRKYVNGERCLADPEGRGLDDLPDSEPIFLSERGSAYTYPAYYANWIRACAAAQIAVTPHQIRHWHVTNTLIVLDKIRDGRQRQAEREKFISYMAWKSPSTIRAYDHHLHQLSYQAAHAALVSLWAAPDTPQEATLDLDETPPGGLNALSEEMEQWLNATFGLE